MMPQHDAVPTPGDDGDGEMPHGRGARSVRYPRKGLVVVLTGAGVSAASGLPTFRGPGGLWEGHRASELATPDAFARNPELVHGFYNARRRQLGEEAVRPNAAHLALARLEAAWPGELLLVTQNVDDLHERSGSRHVMHMHGELLRARCQVCGSSHPWRRDLGGGTLCPGCHAIGRLRPDVVWFGEMPRHLDVIMGALGRCDLFVAVGTSGQVYPAAGFVDAVRAAGRSPTLELNLEPGASSRLFTERRFGPATELVPALVDELLARTR
jgi:NAD-dependent deacetylase